MHSCLHCGARPLKYLCYQCQALLVAYAPLCPYVPSFCKAGASRHRGWRSCSGSRCSSRPEPESASARRQPEEPPCKDPLPDFRPVSQGAPEQQTISCFSSKSKGPPALRIPLSRAPSKRPPRCNRALLVNAPIKTRDMRRKASSAELQSGCTVSLVVSRLDFSVRHLASTNSTWGDLFQTVNGLTGRRPLFPNSSFVWSSSLTKASTSEEHQCTLQEAFLTGTSRVILLRFRSDWNQRSHWQP